MQQFPIDKVRASFKALERNSDGRPLVYFDGPGGTQMAQETVEAMTAYIQNGMANLHGAFPTSRETEALIEEARSGMAALLNGEPEEVAFGPNMTTLAFSIARGLSPFIGEGDEIVVTELDHRANVDPWLTLARDRGATVRFIELDPESCTLDLSRLDEVITDRTKLVAAGLSSNVTGTVTPVKQIIRRAKEVGALTVLDGVHAVPHLTLDFKRLGCDILLCSAYKFFGPHLGIALIRKETFEALNVYKLEPAPAGIPEKLETGTQNHEGIAGLTGTLRFLERLGEGETRRERLVSAIERIDAYEQTITADLEEFFASVPGLRLFRAPAGTQKTPTFAFTLKDHSPREMTEWFADHCGICVADGDFYASTMAEKYGLQNEGGWVRIGIAPYNTKEEVELFKNGLLRFAGQHSKDPVRTAADSGQ